ncbi:MAG TPA: hypothetical protein VET88_10960 [Gammaproteobacteria bacterium]|nr:hypothetical protein [Gammaproteobacteria bacterium]
MQQKQARADSVQTEPESLQAATTAVTAAVRRQLAALLELFTLELRYSGLMLGSAVAMAVIAALAALSVWGLMLASALSWLHAAGWSWAAALVFMALANSAIVLLSLRLMQRALMRIGIDNTRRALQMERQDDAD